MEQLQLFSTPDEVLKLNDEEITRGYEPCLDTSTCSQELEASAWRAINLGEYEQLNLLKSTPTHKQSCVRTSQISPSTQISETTTQSQESLKLSQWDGRVREHQMQGLSKDSNIQLPHSGEKDLDALSKLDPSSVLWNSLKELSDGDLELFLPPSIWQDTVLKLKQSRRESLGLDTKDSECLSFPTLTSGQTSTKMRPAGQTKCEKWFKDKGLIPSGSQLGTKAMALTMGFPSNWFEVLSQENSKNPNIQRKTKPQAELEQDTSQEEPLPQHKQRSLSVESSISIPCLVKQPKQSEVKGVIRKDLGDCFIIYIPSSGSTIAVSKLFVYPDFSESVGQSEKSPRKKLHPSTNNPRKTRRKKGQGNGSIYYRTVTKNNGKQYQEAYYHYVENGKKRTKYIPKKLLDRVQEAESLKLPVSDILVLLGGDKKNPRKSSSTSSARVDKKLNDSCVDRVLETDNLNPRKTIPPSTRRRKQGYGAGYIELLPIKRSGKEYKQYWYHWEIWREGERVIKKSRYIPKRLLARVEKLEVEKAPVKDILKVLGKREDK